MASNPNTGKQGFASMDPKKQRDIASKGGQASHSGGFSDKKLASDAGRKGGQSSGRSR